MTPEQRYFFDLCGYLHVENVLGSDELRKAQEAADRYISSDPEDVPPGFSITYAQGPSHLDGHAHGFAFDKALEALTMHQVTWPIIKELTGNKPRFTSGTLAVNTARHRFHPLHSLKEDVEQSGPEMPRYFTQDGRVYSDNFVVFFYLTDVYPGDGGLILVPGSHKSEIPRPPDFFYQDTYDNEGYVTEEVLPGVANVIAKAGDVVFMSEMVSHGVLNWKPKDRDRRFLTLRYAPQYIASSGKFPDEILERLSPETRELVAVTGYAHTKEVAKLDRVRLT
jgi:ectoine hydroxylase-related dioxygenase (phytanoyl-CoA dioxygenase family)